MGKKSILVALVLCWNELPYLKNLIPQYQTVCDEIVILDGNSTDGTKEGIEETKPQKVRFYQREFDQCSKQFNYGLRKISRDNTWVINITADELPTTYFFQHIRAILDRADEENVDRIWMSAFHLRGEREIANEVGGQLRIFRNDQHHFTGYLDYPHERLHGRFDGHCIKQPDERFAYVHFRQADPKKIQDWKFIYVEKGVYSLWDINKRLNHITIPLPESIEYKVNKDLRKHLGWTTT